MKNHWLIDKMIDKPTGDQWSPLQNESVYYLIRISDERIIILHKKSGLKKA